MIRHYLSNHHIKMQDETQYYVYSIQAKIQHNKMIVKEKLIPDCTQINILSLEEYNTLHGRHVTLQPNEVLWLNHSNAFNKETKFSINAEQFSIKEYVFSNKYAVGKNEYNIVANEQTIKHLATLYIPDIGMVYPEYIYAFNTNKTVQGMHAIIDNLNDKLLTGQVPVQSSDYIREEYLLTYGAYLFVGIFLGIEFLLATALVIYYKQISEGYEDKEKYEIMKKVGMNTKEIKKSIRFQVLSVFFLPILVAIIHFVFLSKTIASLALQITNITIFQTCSIATILTFCIFYTIVYFVTSKVYYKIIK